MNLGFETRNQKIAKQPFVASVKMKELKTENQEHKTYQFIYL